VTIRAQGDRSSVTLIRMARRPLLRAFAFAVVLLLASAVGTAAWRLPKGDYWQPSEAMHVAATRLLATTPAPGGCRDSASVDAGDFGRVDQVCVSYFPAGQPSVTFTQVNSVKDVRLLVFKSHGEHPLASYTCWRAVGDDWWLLYHPDITNPADPCREGFEFEEGG
jgi:hypothetical protein